MIRLPALALLAAALLGCSRDAPVQTQGFLLYGMMIQLSLPGTDAARMETALATVEQTVKQEYATLHPWQDSPLTRLNAALPRGEWVPLEPGLRDIIARTTTLERDSDAAFSPAIGALVRLWGFHSSDPDRPRTPPAQADIDRLMTPPPRMADLEIDGERTRSRQPGLQLDFNAVAEGWAAEQAAQRLHAQGIHDALIDAGGDLRILGNAGGRSGNRPWRIALQDPFEDGPMAGLEVEGDVAVFTSGSYRKRFEHQGVSYSHIIDPRSGWPSHDVIAATVVTHDAVLADAAATALVAAGLKDAPAVARDMGVDAYLLVDDRRRLLASPALAPRLEALRKDRPLVILSP